jgi:hypothetical protein
MLLNCTSAVMLLNHTGGVVWALEPPYFPIYTPLKSLGQVLGGWGIPFALVMDLHVSKKHYERSRINHRCINS